MDLESAQNNVVAKFPLLKQLPRITTNADGTSSSTIPGPVTTEEKTQKKNDVKARSMLLIALPNEHLLTFSQYNDVKTLFKAIQARFYGNDATKKTQRTLLKQVYENFNAPSTESLDSIFNRLQKIISQLAILGENISQKDLNMKFLRSLPYEWNTHVVVWRNKADLDTMSIDDLYNNFKIVKQEVKRTVTSSSSSGSQNMAFLSSPSSTNEVDTANIQVSTVSTPVSTVSSHDNTANLSDATVYAFLANQPNGSQLVHEDLEQIHDDDLEKIDLNWQLALLSMRARKSPRQQESRPRNQDSSRKTVNVEDTSFKAMVSIDGAGFDWSYMADDEVPTNMALMAFSDSEYNKSEFDLATYKRGLASVEEQLVFYKKNEVMFCDQIDVLKRDASFRDSEINALNLQVEKLKKEKESNQIKINNFENAPKSLDKLIGSQITYNSRTGYGPKDSKSVCVDTSNEIKKVPNAPIIKDWVFDSDENEYGEMKLGVGFQFTKKACFVCGSFNHLIKDYDFHDEKMVQKPVLKNVEKGTGQRKVRPVWNNPMRTNHQNFSNSIRNFALMVVSTKSGIVPISTARKSSSRAAAPVSAARPINTDASKLLVNVAKPRQNALHNSHSLSKRPFYQPTALKNRNLNNKVNTAKGLMLLSPQHAWSGDLKSEYKIMSPKTADHTFGDPQDALKDQGYFDSKRSRHMTGNISYLTDFKEHNGGYVAFEGGAKGGKINGKGTIRTGKLDFKDAYFVKELQFNLFSVSQMCDKKNSVLFTDNECFVLSSNFKFADESQVLLKVPRKNNMYSFDIKSIVPQKDLTCLLAKATNDESMLWHMRLGHINFKNINKLVKDNLVRGLSSKRFENNQTYVACLKGKQHKVSFKSKIQNSISQPLFMLHMDLFGPTFVSSIMHKKYCIVIIDDFSRFTWVFFLATKDETSKILKSFITEIEYLVEKKIIRCNNGMESKNRVMNELCEEKGIKRDYSVARTPQQNRVSERRNKTLIGEERTMVLVVNPHFKTLYELFKGRSPALSFMRPFGCHVTILNTLEQLGKFDGKSDEGIFVGYSTISKAFRVYNTRTRKVEENLLITFLKNKPMIVGGRPEWLFDIDALLKSMNYAPVPAGTHSNDFAGKGASFDAGHSSMKTGPSQEYILMPLWKDNSLFDSSSQDSDGHNKDRHGPSQASETDNQERPNAESSIKTVNTTGLVNIATPTYVDYPSDPLMPDLEDTGIFDDAYDDRDEGAEADYTNLETIILVSHIPSTRIHKDHPKE
nr:hypothetical protein [Tanacetum cinerariifolium]